MDTGVIPGAREDDFEDVHWALSAATTLWKQGDDSEALKWLRRAAGAAADHDADRRAVELFKAAADVANQLEGKRTGGRAPCTKGKVKRAKGAAPQQQTPPPGRKRRPSEERSGPRHDDSDRAPTVRRVDRHPGLVFDESEEETFVRPETALRRALMAIDPEYTNRVDLPPQSRLRAQARDGSSQAPAQEDSEEMAAAPTPSEQSDALPLRRRANKSHRSASPSLARQRYETLVDRAAVREPEDEVSHDRPTSKGSVPPADGEPREPRPPARSLPPGALPTLRVAILPIPEEGDVRLIFLAPGVDPPPGVAVAMLVPPSEEDAKILARVYRDTDAKL